MDLFSCWPISIDFFPVSNVSYKNLESSCVFINFLTQITLKFLLIFFRINFNGSFNLFLTFKVQKLVVINFI